MGWTDNHGDGPWGSPPKDKKETPDHTPPPKRGKKPPFDVDDFLRRSYDKIRSQWPQAKGSGSFVGVVVGILVVLWLASGLYRVQPDEQGVELFLGQVSGSPTGPGLHYHWPYPFEMVHKVRTRFENQVVIGGEVTAKGPRKLAYNNVSWANVDDGLMLTGDENIINIVFAVRWVINDPVKFLFQIRNPEESVKKAAASAIREVVGRTRVDAILTGDAQNAENTGANQEISVEIRDRLQAMLDSYESGISITGTELKMAEVPQEVIESYLEVRNASQVRERLRNEAETYRNDILPKAQGDAVRLVQEAEGYREKTISLAKGEVQRYLSVYTAYAQSKDITARRMYLETMEHILKGTPKIILDDSSPKNGPGVLPYLPLNDLLNRPSASKTPSERSTP